MKDQAVEEKFIIQNIHLVENHFLAAKTMSDTDNNRLAKIFFKKLPRNTGMARLFVENTKSELKGGLDTVEKACNRVKKLLSLERQAIRIASLYGPDQDVFRIERKDEEIPSSPPTHDHTQHEKRSANDVIAATPAFVSYCECCGGWGHERPFCKWSKHPMANNSDKSFKNSNVASIWRLVGANKLMTNKLVPGHEAVKKDDYNARKANNPPNKLQKVSANYKGSNPKPYDQLLKQNTATNSSGNVNENRSKSLPLIVTSTIVDTELTEYLNVTVSKCKQTTTTGLKAAPLRLTSRGISPPPKEGDNNRARSPGRGHNNNQSGRS
jgi:hypothetical protein